MWHGPGKVSPVNAPTVITNAGHRGKVALEQRRCGESTGKAAKAAVSVGKAAPRGKARYKRCCCAASVKQRKAKGRAQAGRRTARQCPNQRQQPNYKPVKGKVRYKGRQSAGKATMASAATERNVVAGRRTARKQPKCVCRVSQGHIQCSVCV